MLSPTCLDVAAAAEADRGLFIRMRLWHTDEGGLHHMLVRVGRQCRHPDHSKQMTDMAKLPGLLFGC